ncbi:MAG TPA: transcriptional regulator NrdR [Pirellulaceae bacterium]
MLCPYCRCDNDRVIDSRSADDGFSIRRRRECLKCSRRYTTYERLEEPVIRIVKKDGTREPFEATKLREGISKACWKRPISEEQIDRVIVAIQERIYNDFDKEVESNQLGELVMEKLKLLDQVAYIRFASVYREFQDVRDFVQEMEPMLRDVVDP